MAVAKRKRKKAGRHAFPHPSGLLGWWTVAATTIPATFSSTPGVFARLNLRGPLRRSLKSGGRDSSRTKNLCYKFDAISEQQRDIQMKLSAARTATSNGTNLGSFSVFATSCSEPLSFIACEYQEISDKPDHALPFKSPWLDEERCIVSDSIVEGGRLTMDLGKVLSPLRHNPE